MIKNYILLALRSLFRKSAYSLINIIGLSAGLVCVIFIFNWVLDESTYDSHLPKQVYRVVAEVGTGEDRWHQTVTSLPMGPTISSSYPEVASMTRLDYNDAIIEKGNEQISEDNIVLTDPAFFEVFNYPILRGNAETALSKPYQIVLTESLAEKYFPGEDPIGKSLKIYMYDPDGLGMEYKITGIIADPPPKSHFTFNMLGSLNTIESANPGSMDVWMNNSYYTYLRLREDADPIQLESKFPEMVELNIGEQIEEFDLYYRFYLQPVSSIHLHSDLQYEIMVNGKIEYIWIFSVVGVLILVLAIINYVNLTTSFSFDRSREIGVRKVMGAMRHQLIVQHLMEALLLSIFAVLIAWLSTLLIKPLFYSLTGKYYMPFSPLPLLLQLLIVGIPIGLVAGYFPARLLSGLNTLKSLKGKIVFNTRNSLRSVLVAFQFMVTIIILVGLVVVRQQLKYVQSKDLGYDKENLMVLRVNGSEEVKAGFEPFKQELLNDPNIQMVARSGSMIANGLGNSNGRITRPDGDVQFEKIYRLSVDFDYIDAYGIRLISGRDFDPEIHSDSTEAFILNESTIRAFGWEPDEAIGKTMNFIGREGKIIGVVKDFHFNTLHHKIEPVCLFIRDNFSRITVKGMDIGEMNERVAASWNKFFPSSLFDFSYQDQVLVDTYRNDQRFGTLFNVFSVLSILIAFLGLFGLVGFTVHKKTKEIGIRKVLGATTLQILNQISFSFLKIVAFAAILAIPFAWLAMDSWLSEFPYRINLSPKYFLYSVFVLMAGSLLIIIIQSIKTSLTNPAETLKEE